MNRSIPLFVLLVVALSNLVGCASKQAFSTSGRPGETVALYVGWHPELQRKNLTVTVQPCLGSFYQNYAELTNTGACTTTSGSPIVYNYDNPKLRAVMNLYPDPLSTMVFRRETAPLDDPMAFTDLGKLVEQGATGLDKEYLQTVVLITLPPSFPVDSSVASVTLSDLAGADLKRLYVHLLHVPDMEPLDESFAVWDFYDDTIKNNYINNFVLSRLERTYHKTVTFSSTSTTVPHAIQINLNHMGGTFYAVNPRGDVKNLNWADSSNNLSVILTPAWSKDTSPAAGQTLGELVHFKFYVAGDTGIDNLSIPEVGGVQAFDINGSPIIGVSATLQ